MIDAVRKGIREGKTEDEIVASLSLESYAAPPGAPRWIEGVPGTHVRNVRVTFQRLTGQEIPRIVPPRQSASR